MPQASAKPTFITLGPLRVRRRHFIGVYEDLDSSNDKLEVLLGADGYGIYTQFIKNQEAIEDFWDDYTDYQSQGML